jgi:hypothetical protein
MANLTSRDRRRFERAAARAMRPAGPGSLSAVLGQPRTWVIVGVVAIAGAVGVYTWGAPEAPRTPELTLGGAPASAPEPTQAAAPTRPTDDRPASAGDARQTHLRQLQPVLRTDAERLSQVARRVRAQGRVTDAGKDRSDNAAELRALFTSHRVLSGDLPNHYREYSDAKERLRKSVAEQEDELQQTAELVMTKLSLLPVAEPRRSEIAWAVLERCLDKGPGMTLTTRPDGYQYTVRGRTWRYGGGASVAEDEGAAYAAFTSFAPESDVTARCDSLKKRAAGIVGSAEKLSAGALGLADQPTLPGECKYTQSN